MKGFVQGADRQQTTLLPECLDDWVDESNPVRAVDVFVDALELRDLGFDGVDPAATGRPAYHPSASCSSTPILFWVDHRQAVSRRAPERFAAAIGLGSLLEDFAPTIPDWANDQHTLAGRKLGRGRDHFRKEGAKLIPPPTGDDPYEDEAYRLWAIKQRGRP